MDYANNRGEKIGSLDVAISNEKTVTINRINDVTTVTVQVGGIILSPSPKVLGRVLRTASEKSQASPG
jgi:hypothetical protein